MPIVKGVVEHAGQQSPSQTVNKEKEVKHRGTVPSDTAKLPEQTANKYKTQTKNKNIFYQLEASR